MKNSFLIIIWIFPLLTFSQSQSTHYQSFDDGSTTSGGYMSAPFSMNFIVNTWYEDHMMSSVHYQGESDMPGGFQFPEDATFINKIALGGDRFAFWIFPNPFSLSTTIHFILSENKNVSVLIYDLQGKMVKEIINREFQSGDHFITWNGENNYGNKCNPGMYFIVFKTSTSYLLEKMVLIR